MFGKSSLAPTRFRRFVRSVQRLVRDADGTLGIIFSLTLVPIVLLMSATIDYSSNSAMSQRVQDALDAAVLAGAASSNPTTTSSERIATAQQTFNSSIGRDDRFVTGVSFTVDATTAKVTGNATTERTSLISSRLAPIMRQAYTASALPMANLVRALDVVLCVDATGSMWNTLSAVQNNITNFKTNLDTAISAAGYRPFDRTRVRVIYYRDYGGNGFFNLPTYTWYCNYYKSYYGWSACPLTGADLGDSQPLASSSFFDMSIPGHLVNFTSFVSGQTANGGGDLPESGLECLWTAMNSSWTQVGDALPNGAKVTDVFPVISIYTDAGAHPPNFSPSVQNPAYPAAMPRSYADMLSQWNNPSIIDQSHKALLFYGNPSNEDDYYFGYPSAWATIKTWPNFSNPASLTSANNDFITALARGIIGTGNHRLTN